MFGQLLFLPRWSKDAEAMMKQSTFVCLDGVCFLWMAVLNPMRDPLHAQVHQSSTE